MENISYKKWFKKIISIFIELFFILAIFSSLYLFTYPFEEGQKIYVYLETIVVFALGLRLFKDKIKTLIEKILRYFSKISISKMLIIISILMIVLKALSTFFCYFDPTVGDGDIALYSELAKSIASGEGIRGTTISHLYGMAYHLSIFDRFNIPYYLGMFIVFFIGTIVNFYSFNRIIGKEKTFFVILVYLLMPSTILLTFCPTHEVFVYLYFSLFIFLINLLISSEKKILSVLYSILLVIICTLCIFVNPAGYLLCISLVLMIIFTNLNLFKKVLIGITLVCSLLSINYIHTSLGMDDTQTDLNTLYILVRGSSVECNGEHVDGYTEKVAEEYFKKNNIEFTWPNMKLAMQDTLKDQYLYLLTHPIDLIKLLLHKFYIEWSGPHYPIEMAYGYECFGDVIYYVLLAFNALIYLAVISVSTSFNTKQDNNIYLSNIKLLLLGVMGLLLVSLVLNKYSIYMIIFILLISLSRMETKE